jgi:hypothetical protein
MTSGAGASIANITKRSQNHWEALAWAGIDCARGHRRRANAAGGTPGQSETPIVGTSLAANAGRESSHEVMPWALRRRRMVRSHGPREYPAP